MSFLSRIRLSRSVLAYIVAYETRYFAAVHIETRAVEARYSGFCQYSFSRALLDRFQCSGSNKKPKHIYGCRRQAVHD
ncbi:hypothetical protein DK867_15705 [Ochrobactrum sp. POC9]|nr:hypothetical protein DK867_15705 [Ochrobactrum sp. POC9]